MAVTVVEGPDGTRFLGEEVDGVFVTFASVTGPRVKHLVERGKSLQEKLESDDPEEVKRAQEAVDALPISAPKASRGKKTDEPEGGES